MDDGVIRRIQVFGIVTGFMISFGAPRMPECRHF